MRIQILILGFQRLSAGVQGFDFVLRLWWRTPIMVWIIKRVCSHYCPVSTVLGHEVWTALKPGSHVRRKCKCKNKRRLHVELKRKKARYAGAVKDSQTFSKMAVESAALAAVSLLFVVFQCEVLKCLPHFTVVHSKELWLSRAPNFDDIFQSGFTSRVRNAA